MATRVHFHTPDELVDLLATLIAGAAGGSKVRWRKAIGPVTQLPTWCNIRSNWRVTPRGSDGERAVVEQAAAIVRAEHPYIESQQERRGRLNS
ncbi:hypothetical protein [Sphingomonas sp.]|uniref:hypothetical protein n=1 Tax=Sphingomonas sp. TaxID=28214 RepID=UPI003B00017F